MSSIFAAISTNSEILKVTFYKGSLQKPETITTKDLYKDPYIGNRLKKPVHFFNKNFNPDPEYLSYQITDLKQLQIALSNYLMVDLFYMDNTFRKIEGINSIIAIQNNFLINFIEDVSYIMVGEKNIPYDLNQITPIGSNLLVCKNNYLVFYFFDSLNPQLISLITDIETPQLKEIELKNKIQLYNISGIKVITKVIKLNLIKKITVKHTTFKSIAHVCFALAHNPSFEWSEDDENEILYSSPSETILRDLKLEKEILQELQYVGFYKTGSNWTSLATITHLPLHYLQNQGWVVQFNENEIVQEMVYLEGKLNLDVSYKEDWFEIIGEAKFAEYTLSLDDILSKIKKGEKKIQLSGNRISVITDSWIQKLKGLLPFYKEENKQFQLPLAMMGHLHTTIEDNITFQKDFKTEELLNSISDFSKIEKVPVPNSLILELRNYQQDGLNWLAFLNKYNFGGILADDMGLGKTAQVISLLLYKKSVKGKTLNLIVAPKSLLFNWEAEVQKFTKDLKVIKYYGSDRLENLKTLDADILLTTYGTIRNDGDVLSNFKFDGIFLDESQSIKNHQSKTFQSIKLLNGRIKVCMTGTPIENHIGELWSQFQFILPSLLGPYSHFSQNYLKAPTEANFQHLKAMIFPFVLRRKKEDVAKELPEKIEQTILCEMTKNQWEIYENIRTNVKNNLLSKVDAEGLNKSSIHILEALLRLRQAACHTSLIIKDEEKGESGKLQSLMSMIEEVLSENHKALVFSQFREMLHILEAELKSRNIPYFYLDGTTNNRGEIVNQFQSQDLPCVFLISLKAGGVGLNLTAADYVFVFDPWWNPAVEMQAIDRAHRIGQTKTVFAYRMISQNSVEEKIMLLKDRKKNIADKIISSEKSLIQELTREDLEYLFS